MAGKVTFKWNNKAGVIRDAQRAAQPRLLAAGEMLRAQIVENISESTRASGPSLPFNYPHRDTGKLAQSVETKTEGEDGVIVGSTLQYAEFLEVGTKKMDPRPYLLRTLEKMRGRLAAFLGGRITIVKGGGKVKGVGGGGNTGGSE